MYSLILRCLIERYNYYGDGNHSGNKAKVHHNMTTQDFQHRPRRNWLQINLTCQPDQSDILIYELTSLTGAGVQTKTCANEEQIIAYLEKNDSYTLKRTQLDTLVASFPDTTRPTLELTTLEEENWSENWKSNYKPSKLSDHITVKPTWEDYQPKAGEIVIEIDPGMAFGTGLHFSTRLALRHIDALYHSNQRPATVLDVGTGTGILALACAKLGGQKVIAIDNDPDAIVTALDNIKQNHEQHKVECSVTDLAKIVDQVDLAIANITADVLTLLQPDLCPKIKQGGHLVLAGILSGHQAEKISALYEKHGLRLISENHEDEWTGLLFTKSP